MVKCSLNLISYIQRQRKSGCWKCCFQLLKICEDFDQTCYDQMRTPQTNAINKNPLRSWSTNRPTVSWLHFCDCARVHLTCATIPSVCHTVCVEMMTLLLIFYFFVSYLVFDILENNEENLVKDFRTVFWTKKFPFVRFNINTEPSHWTHRDEEFLLLLFLLLGFLSHHLVFLLELLQCSDLRLLEAKCLLLIVRSQPGELLLIALVFLAQRLRTRGRLEEVKRLFVTDKERIKKKYLFQFEHLLFVLVVGGLALAEQNLPLLLQPADLLLEAALLLVQVPDGRLVGHLGCLQGADLTWKQSNWNHVCVLKRLYNQESELTFKLDVCYCYCCLNEEVASAAELLNRKSAVC